MERDYQHEIHENETRERESLSDTKGIEKESDEYFISKNKER